jgi:hypothetical protein
MQNLNQLNYLLKINLFNFIKLQQPKLNNLKYFYLFFTLYYHLAVLFYIIMMQQQNLSIIYNVVNELVDNPIIIFYVKLEF